MCLTYVNIFNFNVFYVIIHLSLKGVNEVMSDRLYNIEPKEFRVLGRNEVGSSITYTKEYSYDAETGVGITDAHYCPNCGAEMSKENKNADSH